MHFIIFMNYIYGVNVGFEFINGEHKALPGEHGLEVSLFMAQFTFLLTPYSELYGGSYDD